MTQNITLEKQLEEQDLGTEGQSKALLEKVINGARNYAIDTSAKVCCYAPAMAAMEAYNGLSGEQILQSRTTTALVDVLFARIYSKIADYAEKKTRPITLIIARNSIKLTNVLRERFGIENLAFGQKRKIYRRIEAARNYCTDTTSMIGVYTPVYAGILAAYGADSKKICSSLIGGAVIAAATSRLFRKYALKPWRKICRYT